MSRAPRFYLCAGEDARLRPRQPARGGRSKAPCRPVKEAVAADIGKLVPSSITEAELPSSI